MPEYILQVGSGTANVLCSDDKFRGISKWNNEPIYHLKGLDRKMRADPEVVSNIADAVTKENICALLVDRDLELLGTMKDELVVVNDSICVELETAEEFFEWCSRFQVLPFIKAGERPVGGRVKVGKRKPKRWA